jgi:nucleotide-binding universal stress UspA family protein
LVQKASAKAARRGVVARMALVEDRGFPIADLIVEYAGRWKADVIVLGTHGRRGFSHLLMGSDAESVVRLSPIPVLLVALGVAVGAWLWAMSSGDTSQNSPGEPLKSPT